MTTENPVSTSFFDDEDGTFKFMKPNNKHNELFSDLSTLRDEATCKCLATNLNKEGIFALYSHYIVFYELKTPDTPKAILDINYARLTLLNSNTQGFKLMKNEASFELIFPDSQTVTYWVDALRKHCVMTNFHSEYKALKLLGQGGFARVYLSECKSTGKHYAVKAFLKEGQQSTYKTNFKAPLRQEIEMLRVIDHENVVKLWEVQETERTVYVVMDYVESKTLQEVIKKPDFRTNYSETQIMSLIHSILNVVAYLASKGIMHRDLKPDNILVEKSGKIKIIDLGLATYVKVPKHIFKRCGTPGFIAPEVFQCDSASPCATYDEKCDVFSVGCLMFYMLYGTPIFGTAKNSQLFNLNKNCTDEKIAIILNKEASKAEIKPLQKDGLTLLKDLLVVDPQKRISAEQAVYHLFFTPILNKMINFTSSKNLIFSSHHLTLTTHYSQNGDATTPINNNCIHSFKGENGALTPIKNRGVERDSFYASPSQSRRASGNEPTNKPPISKFGNNQVVKTSGFGKSEDLNEAFAELQKKNENHLKVVPVSQNGTKTSEKTETSTNDNDSEEMSSVGDEDCQFKKIYFEKADPSKRRSQMKVLAK